MADGLLSLSWNNHKATFCHILSTLREKERYTDVTLACEGKFYPVHKLVLSTCSEYFESMFEHTPCKHPIIVLKDIKSDEVESLLSYMYAGVVNVAQNDLARLIKAAETLKVKGLAVPDEPPPEALPKKSHPPPWSSRDDRSSPHPKRKRREEPEPPVADLQMSSSPPASPKASPYHPANDFQLDRVPNDPKASDSRTDITLERGGEDDSQPDQKSNSRGDHQPPSQPSPLQVVVDDTLVKEEIEEPLEDNQETLLNSGMDYSSMPSDSRLESTANEGGGQDHNQLLPNKFEQPLVSGQQQQPHLPESVVEALAGPSGMQGWLGSGDIGGGFSGVEGYSGDGRHQDLRQAVPSQQPQPHQMVSAVEYAVVEFVKERKVAVAHSSWISLTDQAVNCFWPIKGPVSTLAQKGVKPDQHMWIKREVRLYSYAETYSKALGLAFRVADLSTAEKEGNIKRDRKFLQRYYESDDGFQTETIGKLNMVLETQGKLHLNMDALYEKIEEILTRLPQQSLSGQGGSRTLAQGDTRNVFQPEARNIVPVDTRNICDFEDLLPNPLQTCEELDVLCHRLSTEENLLQLMTASLATLGGNSLADTVRRIIRKLGTNSLWSHYSLKGRKGKIPLIGLPIVRLVIKAARSIHPDASSSVIEAELAEVLKHAPHKKGGAKYKEPALRMNPAVTALLNLSLESNFE